MSTVINTASSNTQENTGTTATPLGGGAQAAPAQPTTPSQAPTGNSQPSTVQSGMSSTQAGAAQQGQQGAGKQASSGMFTNIQKYVDKNKPQAKKMGQAATQKVAQTATDVQKVAQSAADTQNQALASNTAAIGKEKDWATGQVDSIMGRGAAPTQETAQPQGGGRNMTDTKAVAPVAYQPTEDDSARFQSMMGGGDLKGVSRVGDLNIADSNQKARALQQMAGRVGTEQGRKNLLQDTFQGQGQYSRGMGGLDNLIVSGDQEAVQNMTSGVKDTAQGLQKGLSDLTAQQRGLVGEQNATIDNFGNVVTDYATGAGTEVSGNMNSAYQAEMDNRAALGADYDKSIADINAWKKERLAALGDVENWGNISQQILDSGADLGWRGRDYWGSQVGRDIAQSEKDYNPNASYDPNAQAHTSRMSEGRFMDAMQKIAENNRYTGNTGTENLSGTLSGQDARDNVWAGSKSSSKSTGDQFFSKKNIQDQFRNLKSQIEGTDAEALVKGNFADTHGGQSYDDYMAGKGLDKWDTASAQSIDRTKGLQALMGRNDFSDEMRDTGYAKTDAVKSLLKKYGR